MKQNQKQTKQNQKQTKNTSKISKTGQKSPKSETKTDKNSVSIFSLSFVNCITQLEPFSDTIFAIFPGLLVPIIQQNALFLLQYLVDFWRPAASVLLNTVLMSTRAKLTSIGCFVRRSLAPATFFLSKVEPRWLQIGLEYCFQGKQDVSYIQKMQA